MIRDINRFKDAHYDVLVIGGGINGAAVANLASMNGMNVALLEKGDFGSGTSSKSTKLVHGGLRYLENAEFGLVKESLRERAVQLKSAPHLVKPLGFIVPVYRSDHRAFWKMKLGISIYDALSGKYVLNPQRSLSKDEVIHFVPGIQKDGLVGGIIYWDAQMDDARLVLENVLQADSQGAHVANYVEVNTLVKENGRTVSAKVKDLISGEILTIHAKHFISAVGPWTNKFMEKENAQSPQKIRTTKGVHIVYRGKFSDHAVFIQATSGGRIFFVIPWMENTLIGTTDTDYKDHPDEVSVTEKEINYLFHEAERVFPNARFNNKNIITTFAGLRPLVYKKGSPKEISRNHVIESSYSGVHYIMGGKYTTYRKIAQDALNKAVGKKLINTSEKIPLYGGGIVEDSMSDVAKEYDIDLKTVEFIQSLYGTRFKDVLELTKIDPSLKEKVSSSTLVIKAQIKYAIEREMAKKPEDILIRRLPLEYTGQSGNKCKKIIEEMLNN